MPYSATSCRTPAHGVVSGTRATIETLWRGRQPNQQGVPGLHSSGDRERALDLADGLLEALLVLDQGYPKIPLAVLAESAPRRDGDLGFLQAFHRAADQ